MITFYPEHAEKIIDARQLTKLLPRLEEAHGWLLNKNGLGSDFLGWLHLGGQTTEQQIEQLEKIASEVSGHSQVLLVIGIGGSYLGANAHLRALCSPYYNHLQPSTPEIYFVGNSLSGEDYSAILKIIGERDWSINVISKSGTTLEPTLAMRFFLSELNKRYGKASLAKRLIITTDPKSGLLRELANKLACPTLDIPADVGGRYSVFTPVGLFPLAVAGVDIKALLAGVASAESELLTEQSLANPAWHYAATRYWAYMHGFNIELLATYQSRLQGFALWWQQLFGESEGKDGLGLYPGVLSYPADLHSLGQYVQEGPKQILETVLWCESEDDVAIPSTDDFLPVSFGEACSLAEINYKTMLGVASAHQRGGVANTRLSFREFNEQCLGYLGYFFALSCALSAYLLGVNPFDQPGVEIYKREVKQLLAADK